MEGMAYGAGKAGGAFDPQMFFRQPHSVLRMVSWVFSIVIFGSIANEGYVNRPDEVEEYCIFNRNHNACNYGVAMGTLAFLCCLAFLALDVYFPQISSVKDRKKAVLADVGVSEDNPLKEGADAARASITFAFFSIFTWKAAQSVLAFQRYRIGADSALFSQDYTDPSQDTSLPYSSYTGGDDLGSPPTAIPYQQPSNEAFEGTPGYQSQDY
ncbi:UNVERIFIED_CONTAM: hypothetical protein FKN15_022694 [Acipenser sinensis]